MGLIRNTAESREDLVRRVSLLKRNAMAAPFERAFDDFANRQEEAAKFTRESAPEGIAEGGEVMAIHYRDEEAIYIKASHDRVTVIFSTIFREETDRIFGKVFLQVCFGLFLRVCKSLMFYRSSLMLEGEPYKMHRKFYSGMSRLSSFRAFADCPPAQMVRLVM